MASLLANTNGTTGSQPKIDADLLEPLAIIGFSLKYPQDANTPQGFWDLMEERRCAMTEWPSDRINLNAFYHRDESQEDRKFVPGAHFLREDLGAFDAQFFGISATEAMSMDPQHRMLLEVTYHALENAGIPLGKVYGSQTGVYTGTMSDDYKHIVLSDVDDVPRYAATGTTMNMVANRISWFYNFLGPSINMDSACSSSLMALDFACQGLRNGDCEMAVVAGGNIVLAVEPVLSLINMGFLSPNGRCFSFDERADGYSRGGGAVVRSTGSNQDGHTAGLTQPSMKSQAALIRATYEKAGLGFGETRFFEAHGTGTALGDPTEAEAIGSVFRTARSPDDPLYVGALKSNIGHLEGGSGIAGIIKAVMVLERGVIPPNANFEKANPRIDTEFYNLKFPIKSIPWPSSGLRRVSVASFGVGGSNSHAILDDAENYLRSRRVEGNTAFKVPQCIDTDDREAKVTNGSTPLAMEHVPGRLLVFSAADENGIKRLTAAYESHFRDNRCIDNDNAYLENLAYTLYSKRSSLLWRSFAVVKSSKELLNLQRSLSSPQAASKNVSISFVFTGQGAQYENMGAALLGYPTVKATIRLFDNELAKLGSIWSVEDLLCRQLSSSNINDPECSQIATTALQIAIFELLRTAGINPGVVVGHSSGEIAAAYASGALSLASAAKVAYHRGMCASIVAGSLKKAGAMMSIDLPYEEVQDGILNSLQDPNTVRIACVNSPGNVTVSGDEDAIDSIQTKLHSRGIRTRKLNTGVAYHSSHMQYIADEYARKISNLERGTRTAAVPHMISSVTGGYVHTLQDICTPDYWVANMVSTVQFLNAIRTMSSLAGRKGTRRLGDPKLDAIEEIVEIGPHSALRRPILDCLADCAPNANVRYHSVLTRQIPAIQTTMRLFGELYSRGYPVDVQKINEIGRSSHVNCQSLVDLPSYVFDHSTSYWYETSISKHTRLRKFPKLELLGTPAVDWNPLEPRWRKFFDSTETPWIGDHRVNGKAIYPATGMIVMAIEASRQIADPGRSIHAFEIRDAVFLAPISVGGSERSEAQLRMRPEQALSNKNADAFKFYIYSSLGGGWLENCHGTLRVVYERKQPGLDNSVHDTESAFYRRKYEEALERCSHSVRTEDMYSCFLSNGLNYGRAFQSLDNLAWDGGNAAIGDLKCFKWTPEHSQHDCQPHVAHPVTLDAAGQLMWVALSKGAKKTLFNGLAVTRIQDIWISSSGLSYLETDHLRAVCSTSLNGYRGTDCSMFALDPTGKLRLRISHLQTTAVGGDERTIVSNPRQLCFRMIYEPDIDLLNADQLRKLTQAGSDDESVEPESFYEDLELVLFYFASLALEKRVNPETPKGPQKPHIAKFVEWLNLQVQSRANWSTQIKDTKRMEQIATRLENTNAEGQFFVHVSRHLDLILRGVADPLEVMFQNSHAERYYQEICYKMRCCKELQIYLAAISHKSPQLNILEVGAGTGSITEHVLSALCTFEGDNSVCDMRFNRYDYTDISKAFFDRAQEKFEKHSPRMKYGVLDLENDAVSQGYEAGNYDIVVAALVLHATRDLAATIRNVRKLLKPGGKLIMLEITDFSSLRNGLAFGTLPGWWLSIEPERQWGPCISGAQWERLLMSNGFEGIDLVLPDYHSKNIQSHSILIATASTPKEPNFPASPIVVLWNSMFPPQAAVAEGIRTRLEEESGMTCQIMPLHDLASRELSPDSTLVFLVEFREPYLSVLEKSSFENLQKALGRARNVVWVTTIKKDASTSPDLHMVRGFARVLCTEKPSRAFVTLSLDDHGLEHINYARHICQVISATTTSQSPRRELEYVEHDGILMINRVFVHTERNQEIYLRTNTVMKTQSLKESPPLRWVMSNPGTLEPMHFEEDMRYHESLDIDEVEIEIQALGVNFRDLLILLGKLHKTTLGCECAGIVTRVGANCTDIHPGDRVCAAVMGCCNTHVRCHRQAVVKIPDSLSMAEAASLPITCVTAYYSLVVLANLQKQDSILIHCAAGGTGQMMLQVAQAVEAEVYVTVGTAEKKRLIHDLYGVPVARIFNSRDTTFARGIFRATNGRGVDVIVNSLSGESLRASWECIAPCGRFIELGKLDIQQNSQLSMSRFADNVSFHAIAVDYLTTHRPALVGAILRTIVDKVENKSLNVASPLRTYPISQMETAFRHMQAGNNIGKIVLTLDPSDIVPTWLRPKYSCSFGADETYVIAGGLGGLGRSAARWMSQQGAKHLILLSRSGPKSSAAYELLTELQAAGTHVRTPRCDVSSPESLATVLSQCSDMPPIKGCLQATMVLQDNLFETMTWDQWSISIRSKVASTWNLHSQLPSGLSFFIMLSSISGITGSMGQSNYAAGNTYQDGLVAYRQALGERATSIDLGLMGDVGIVAENGSDITKGKETVMSLARISEKELLALLDYYCHPAAVAATHENNQPIVGLVTPAQCRSPENRAARRARRACTLPWTTTVRLRLRPG
ncbi:hypothetical protein NUW58_g5359 [Xylaria curta]|uniref:Uncharacterized protein n=1 Tax=Xylaria curta TaxID=42375 RepID=A0ACC1P2Q9_9PEZI|nr:hypothetical protein NUW58_g5359 [Xylaria curta]